MSLDFHNPGIGAAPGGCAGVGELVDGVVPMELGDDACALFVGVGGSVIAEEGEIAICAGINLHLGDGAARSLFKWALGAAGGLVVIVATTVVIAHGAAQQAAFSDQKEAMFEDRVNKKVEEMKTETRLMQYWGERQEVACTAAGVKAIPLPLAAKK